MCGRVLREPFVDNDETVARVSFNKRLIINECVAKLIPYDSFVISNSFILSTITVSVHICVSEYRNIHLMFNMYNIT